MLRRLEKGLNNAKLKSHSYETTLSQLAQDSRLFPDADLPPLNIAPRLEGSHSRSPADAASDQEEEDDDSDKNAEGMFPAQLIKKENQLQRNSFFRTILNPENTEPRSTKGTQAGGSTSGGSPPFASRTPTRSPSASPRHDASNGSPSEYNSLNGQNGGLKDPVEAGLITEDEAQVFFDMFFLRLNPFINLFDPALHTVAYVRRCPFLFTTLIMACCKFFKPSLYQPVKKLAHEFSVRAFAENWKSVEIVQAFACLTYWKEPDDTRTWTFIGYACRMAIELNLNRFVSEKRLPNETDLQWLERRNRERTYLVLFVHDRSLSTQTGRQWMCHEDEIVRHSARWHEQGGGVAPLDRRPEDVILASFVQLRLIGSETATEIYARNSGQKKDHKEDVNHSELLRECNFKLNQWMEHWEGEMIKAGGENFHTAFIRLFWLYLCLFLNSFGIQRSMSSAPQTSQTPVSMDALHMCFRSAIEHLQSVVDDFAAMSTLRYGQETITVMTAYCSVFLLKLLRNPNTSPHLPPNATADVHKYILRTAEAHDSGSSDASASSSAEHHARFLKGLIRRDIYFETKEKERLREKREGTAARAGSGSPQTRASSNSTSLAHGAGSNIASGTPSYPGPDTQSVPMDQYPGQYQQSPTVSSQMTHADAGYMYASPPLANISPTDASHAVPRTSSHYPEYHSADGTLYGYTDPAAASMVPSQSHHHQTTNLLTSGFSQSDADYSRMMFRNIGDIGFDFYQQMNPQQQYGQMRSTQTQWMMGGDSNYGTAPTYPNGSEYVYHQQRGYDGYQR